MKSNNKLPRESCLRSRIIALNKVERQLLIEKTEHFVNELRCLGSDIAAIDAKSNATSNPWHRVISSNTVATLVNAYNGNKSVPQLMMEGKLSEFEMVGL